jgi:hypothetical protein
MKCNCVNRGVRVRLQPWGGCRNTVPGQHYHQSYLETLTPGARILCDALDCEALHPVAEWVREPGINAYNAPRDYGKPL